MRRGSPPPHGPATRLNHLPRRTLNANNDDRVSPHSDNQSAPSGPEGLEAAARAARTSYAKLLSLLASRTRDLAAAEDALAEAFAAALEQWPAEGAPANPDAWLLTVARRRLIDSQRHALVERTAAEHLAQQTSAHVIQLQHLDRIPDDRLRLLFVCAHPAIEPAARTPLLLQSVLGLDTAAIASAFLVSPAALAQRLLRAKQKIRHAGISFDLPEQTEWPARLDSVLSAIYAAYNSGWEFDEGRPGPSLVAEDALWLGRVLLELMPREPEALGLLALMLLCESRRGARRDEWGGFVPLARQDPARWSAAMIHEAEALLHDAAALGVLGRFQLEAAIQSAHADRLRTGRTDWPAIVRLYEGLLELAPSLGARVAHAAASAEHQGADRGLALLDDVRAGHASMVASHQPYWATRAHLLRAAGQHDLARAAYTTAAGLCGDPSVRAFLLNQAGECSSESRSEP